MPGHEHGKAIKKADEYEALEKEGYSKSKAAAISNEAAKRPAARGALDADRREDGRGADIRRRSDRRSFTGGAGHRRAVGGRYGRYGHRGSERKTGERTAPDEGLYARRLHDAKGSGDEDSYEPQTV